MVDRVSAMRLTEDDSPQASEMATRDQAWFELPFCHRCMLNREVVGWRQIPEGGTDRRVACPAAKIRQPVRDSQL